ncbi:MAG TPA: hypothetical protein VG320_15860, partial [Paraburkholderia sp.]|nr:hypothetical protein [Paraburkholderia sp.]
MALGGNSVANTAAVGTSSGVIGGTTYNYAGTAPVGTVSVGSAGAERTITNVAAGQITASSTDAVNGSQLYATNTKVTQNTSDIAQNTTSIAQNTTNIAQNTSAISNLQGDVTNMAGTMADAVMYDSSAHASVTLGGVGSTTPVALHNVAAGALSASSYDAVNGSQLYATNTQVAQNTSDIAKNTSAISNLQGDVTNMAGAMANAVMYDSSAHASVTLGGVGSTTPVALHNVAAGAVNASSFDAVNGSQLYNVASSTASAIGGGSTVNSDGSISAPTYSIGGSTFNSVAGAVTNLDSRVTKNTTDISNLQGDITNMAGAMADAVMYDSSAHASVTLGGVGSTTPVALHNVAAGAVNASSFDAV